LGSGIWSLEFLSFREVQSYTEAQAFSKSGIVAPFEGTR